MSHQDDLEYSPALPRDSQKFRFRWGIPTTGSSDSQIATGESDEKRPEDFRRTKFFFYLTAICFVMFVINMLQVALLDHIDSIGWILVFPLVLFVVMMAAFSAWVWSSREIMLKDWKNTSWEIRTARIGICLGMILPVICCEFVYLNLVAVPAHRQKTWQISLSTVAQIQAPSVAIIYDLEIAPTSATIIPIHNNQTDFRYLGEAHNKTLQVSNLTYHYRIYDAASHPGNITFDSTISLENNITLAHEYDIAELPTSAAFIAFFDPRFTEVFELAAFCNLIQISELPLTTSSSYSYGLVQQTTSDKVHAMDLSSVDSRCQPSAFPTDYNSYAASILPTGKALDLHSCSRNSTNFTGPCTFYISMYLLQYQVVTEESTRGTSWTKIIFDEGSIVGGITFFTWFLSIYMV